MYDRLIFYKNIYTNEYKISSEESRLSLSINY